ncbi:hypothetical protein JCM10213_008489 [Rhodosporidiobolus nylandii]
MCIVFWHVGREDEPYSLIVASNRDEFLARPTSSVAWHDWTTEAPAGEPTEQKRVLSGLDLTAGGTWFGVSLPPADRSKQAGAPILRFATLTNFTETLPPAARPSRGDLTRNFLDLDSLASSSTVPHSLEEYLASVEAVKQQYAGFNLLVGEISLPSPPSSAAAASSPSVRLAYISNRESPTKHARILDPGTSASESESVRGLSNASLEVEEGEEEWPKVRSGALAVEAALERCLAENARDKDGEEKLADGLYEALSASHPSPILDRSHLRHTVLVRPLCLDPTAPLPTIPPPFPPAPPPSSSADAHDRSDPAILPPTVTDGKKEGEDGAHWYGTRVQTLLLVGRDGKVVLRERGGYTLRDGRPAWSGAERRFDFRIR